MYQSGRARDKAKRRKSPPKAGELASLHLGNEHRNSILMKCHYPDLGSAYDWLEICFIQSEACHQYGISAIVSQTIFHGETIGSVAKYHRLSQARVVKKLQFWL